jgi:hypothetical protein
MLSSTGLNFLRREFIRYVKSCGKGHLVKRGKLNLKYIPKREAAERLMMSKRWLKRFISEGKLKTVVKEDWGVRRLFVETESVEKLKEELSRLLDVPEVGKQLGVPPWLVYQLAQAGYIMPARGPYIDGYKVLKFDPKEAAKLIKSITSRLPECDPLYKQCTDLRVAVRRFGPSKLSLLNKIKAILDGKILPRMRPPDVRRVAIQIKSLYLPY